MRGKIKGRAAREVFSGGEPYPYLERRTRAGELSTICSRAARESRSAASCACIGGTHRPPRERLASSLADRHPHACFPGRSRTAVLRLGGHQGSGSWVGKRASGPERRGCGPTSLVPFPPRRAEENSRGRRGFQPRNRPASPSLPAGANSRVTPVLARSHSRAPARADRTCSPSWQKSVGNSVLRVEKDSGEFYRFKISSYRE